MGADTTQSDQKDSASDRISLILFLPDEHSCCTYTGIGTV